MEVETKTKKRKRSEHSKSSAIVEPNFEGALNNPNFTQRTVLVLSQKSEAEITTQNISVGGSFPVSKDVLGASWKGVLTYCRIANDLSPLSSVSVFSVGSAVTRLNQWGNDMQLPDIIHRASQLKTVTKANLLKGLEAAVKALGDPSNEIKEDGEDDGKTEIVINRSRIVCVFQDQSNVVMEYSFTKYLPNQGGPSYDLIKSTKSFIDNTNEEMTKGYTKGKLIENCDIIFISILSDSVKMVPAGKIYQISTSISVETHFITASNLQNGFIDLSFSHFNLGSLSVSSSPNSILSENEEQESNQIELFYSQNNTIHVLDPIPHFTTTTTLGSNNWRSRTTLCQVFEDRGQSCDNMATSSVHRAMSSISNNISNQFLQLMEDGKSMLLRILGSENNNNPSMFIKVHGNEIFLHKLYEDHLHLDSVPNFFSPNYSKIKLEEYKVEEFNHIMNQTLFQFNDRHGAKKARTKIYPDPRIDDYHVSSRLLTSATEAFPIKKSGTMLFTSFQSEELKSMLNQIISLLRKPILEKNAFNIIFNHLTKISQDIKINSYSLIREKDQEKRKNQYKLLWNEIYKLVESIRNISDKHLKLFSSLDSIYVIPKIDVNQNIMNIEIIEKEREDPERYRYTPRYKYTIPDVKTGNEEKEKRYADKTHKETPTPSLLDPNEKSLQSLFWNKFNANHIEIPFAGYPK